MLRIPRAEEQIMDLREIESLFNERGFKRMMESNIAHILCRTGKRTSFVLTSKSSEIYTDGNKIVVGLPNEYAGMTYGEIYSMVKACVGHESAHVKWSNFNAIKGYLQEVNNRGISSSLGHSMFNIIEDGRIERLLCEELPGYIKHIKFLNSTLIKKDGNLRDAEHVLGNIIGVIHFLAVLGVYPINYTDLLEEKERDLIESKIHPLVLKGVMTNSYKVVQDVCLEILDLLKDYIPEPQSMPQELIDLLEALAQESYQSSDGQDGEDRDDLDGLVNMIMQSMQGQRSSSSSQNSSNQNQGSDKNEQDDDGGDSNSQNENQQSQKSSSKQQTLSNSEVGDEDGDENSQHSNTGSQSSDSNESQDNEEEQKGTGSSSSSNENCAEEKSGENKNITSGDSESDNSSDEEESNGSNGEDKSSNNNSEDKQGSNDKENPSDENDLTEDNQNKDGANEDNSTEENAENNDSSNRQPDGDNTEDSSENKNESDQSDNKEVGDLLPSHFKDENIDGSDFSYEKQEKDFFENLKEEINEEAQRAFEKIEEEERRGNLKQPNTFHQGIDIDAINSNYSSRRQEPNFRFIHPNYPFRKPQEEFKMKIHGLRKVFEKILKNDEINYKGQKKGRLDTARLWRVGLNDSHVFKKRNIVEKSNYSVEILIDISGSMYDRVKYKNALGTAICIEGALNGLDGVEVKTVAFNFEDGTRMLVLKDFNDKESKTPYAYETDITDGCNRDGFAIRVALDDLNKRNTKNKLLIVISDGTPNARPCETSEESIQDVKDAVHNGRKDTTVMSVLINDGPIDSSTKRVFQYMYEEKGSIMVDVYNEPDALMKNIILYLKKMFKN